MIKDDNKQIESIEYSYLNLPIKLQLLKVSETKHIYYLYDASGNKLRKHTESIHANVVTTDYIGNFVYEDNQLKYVLTAEGRIVPGEQGGYDYQYFLKDHLGSTRVLFNSAGPLEVDSYYPFGMLMEGFGGRQAPDNENKYLYNGKELQDDFGLDWYDYGARFYDATLGRWHSVDPLSGDASNWSPYSAMWNNPIIYVDADGRWSNPIYGYDGAFLGTDSWGLQGDAIIMNQTYFEQGMAHEFAMSVGSTLDNMSTADATKFANNGNFENFLNHYNNLPNRIDYSPDFVLTKEIADKHWQGKSGEGLYVNQANIQLPGVSTASFDNKDGSSFYKNFVWGLSNTGKVYGTLKLTLQKANSGTVHIGGKNFLDEYDYTMDGRLLRDFATWYGRPGAANDGKKYFIYGYGKATVPVKK